MGKARISIIFLSLLIACHHPNAIKNETPQAPTNPYVVIRTPTRSLKISVELAVTPEQRERGLMFRKHLEDLHGMLFIFPSQGVRKFWMKNTYIPLDMLFIDQNGVIVGIVENAQPLNTELLGPDQPFTYVLEIKGGTASKFGIRTGTVVDLTHALPN